MQRLSIFKEETPLGVLSEMVDISDLVPFWI